MTIPLKIPEVGESITEVTIGDWLKSEGDAVERDEEIVVIETEKATVEISAPQAGTLVRILKPSGETARVGDVIGEIDESARAERPPEREIRGAQSVERAVEDDGSKARPPSRGPVAAHEPGVTRPARGEESVSTERRPEVKSEARGPVRAPGRPLAEEPRKGAAQAEPSPLEPRRREAIEEPAKGPTVSSPATAAREETVVRMTPLRRRIAERLVESQKTTAHLTTFNEIDMTEVLALRERYRDAFQERHRVKLGLMSFFVKAVIDALQAVPEVNAEIRGEQIVYRNYYDIGVAVGGGKGLVVPVLRNAQTLSFAEVERAIADFAARARENRLAPDELQGGTFTISNGGIYGSLLSTPILNPPQSGILGMHAIQQRPVARDGAVVIRPMMYVALTYDHRLVDGREAVTFLKHVKDAVEDPARLLLQL